MGAFTGDETQINNLAVDQSQKSGEDIDDGYPTDVEGIKADGKVTYGKEEFPKFKVTPKEFFSNMKADRRRIRFAKDSKAGEYMRKTKNQARPFYLETTTADGKSYVKKVR